MAFINKLLGGGAASKVQEAAQTVAERTPVFRFGGWQKWVLIQDLLIPEPLSSF